MARTFSSAYVTGASSGIGRELAARLAQRGTEVVAVARRLEQLESLQDACAGFAGNVHVEVLDVADVDAVRASVLRFDGRFENGLDLVVANAGVGLSRHAHDLGWDDVRRTFEVNVLGAAATLVAGLECMRARGRGTLCGVSSLAGTGGMPGSGAYSASKAALSALLESWRIDLAGSDVRVVDVQPGYVHTEMTADAEHALPFVWTVERATARILRGLERGDARVRFPWQLCLPLALLDSGPRGLWRAAMAAIGRGDVRRSAKRLR